MAESRQDIRADNDNPSAERGSQYPADNLESAIDMLNQIKDAVGFAPAQREILASAIGYKTLSGHAGRKLGSLSHHDLIERSGRGAARISALGKSILIPTSEKEKQAAIAEAAKRPNLYAALMAKYSGNALPTLLPNLLVREHGIHPSVAEMAATTFRETMEFAGLMRNGVLYDDVEPVQKDVGKIPQDTRQELGGSFPIRAAADRPVALRPNDPAISGYTIPLDNAGRIATIQIPLPLTSRDLKKISAWLAYMETVVGDGKDNPDARS